MTPEQLAELGVTAPVRELYLLTPRTLSSYCAVRAAHPVWRHLSKHGRLCAYIFYHVDHLGNPVQR